MSCPAHALAASRRMLVREDVDLIRELVGRLPTIRKVFVVDLGAGSGTTALAVFAERAERVKVSTIDIDSEALRWAAVAVENIGRLEDWEGFQGEADKGPEADWPRVDLLLLDADHSYQAVKRDLVAWLPSVKRGGLVWVHDYGDPADFGLRSKATPGVKRAVDEFVRKGDFKETKVRGLGWAGEKV